MLKSFLSHIIVLFHKDGLEKGSKVISLPKFFFCIIGSLVDRNSIFFCARSDHESCPFPAPGPQWDGGSANSLFPPNPFYATLFAFFPKKSTLNSFFFSFGRPGQQPGTHLG